MTVWVTTATAATATAAPAPVQVHSDIQMLASAVPSLQPAAMAAAAAARMSAALESAPSGVLALPVAMVVMDDKVGPWWSCMTSPLIRWGGLLVMY